MQVKTVLPRLVLAAIAIAFSASAAAAMYKWTDKQGNVHYTQEPPQEGEAAEIAPPPRVTPPATKTAEKSKNEADNGEGEEELTPEQQEAYKRDCETAKANLELYRTSQRIKQAEDGKVVTMNEELRAKKMQEAEALIQKFCK